MSHRIYAALHDIFSGGKNWSLWSHLSWREIRGRYARTILGPFWVTAGMGITIFTLGILYSILWEIDIKRYLPYYCVGAIVWNMFSMIVNEGCNVFIHAGNILKEVKIPYTVFAIDVVTRNLIHFFHCIIVFFIILLFFPVPLTFESLLVIPGLILFALNAVWIVLLLGIFGTRFRDLHPLITNIMQALFFLTPVIWMPDMLGGNRLKYILINANPAYHFIEVIRAPLLGHTPSLGTWVYLLLLLVLGWLVTVQVFSVFRKRIIFWL